MENSADVCDFGYKSQAYAAPANRQNRINQEGYSVIMEKFNLNNV
jgi:hypothetical protein